MKINSEMKNRSIINMTDIERFKRDHLISYEDKILSKNDKHKEQINRKYQYVSLDGGKYQVQYNEKTSFFRILQSNTGKHLFAERVYPNSSTAFRLDFDVKSPISEYQEYKRCDVEKLISICNSVLRNVFEDVKEENLICFLLEKDAYEDGKGNKKKGFHLHYPRLRCVNKYYDKFVLPRLKEKVDEQELFSNLPVDKPSVLIDGCFNNSWLMYGGVKEEGKQPYLLSRVYDSKSQLISLVDAFKDYNFENIEEEISLSTEEEIRNNFVRILSLYCQSCGSYKKLRPEHERKDNYDKFLQKQKQIEKEEEIKEIVCDDKEIQKNIELIRILTDVISDPHKEWFSVICHIKSHSHLYGGLENAKILTREFSQLSEKYDEEGFNITWRSINENRMDIGLSTIQYYAFLSNKTVYNAWKKKYKVKDDSWKKKVVYENVKEMKRKYDDWVEAESMYYKKRGIVINAGLGKGKSTASFDLIKNGNFDRIIVLVPRRTYARAVFERLERDTGKKFTLYLNATKKDFILEKGNIVVQCESLYRLKFKEDEKICVIMDECESILYQMTSPKTHSKNHAENVYTLELLMKEANKIVCMDAFISNRTFDFLDDMNVDYDAFNYVKKLQNRKAIECKNIEQFENKLISDLKNGKKIYAVISSKNLLQILERIIKNKFKDKKILTYTGDYSSSKLENVNEEWSDADLILTTTTITVGINFDTKDVFHKIYVFASACSKNLVRDIFQCSYRVRHIIDNEMVFCLDTMPRGINVSVNRKQIDKELKTNKHLLLEQYNKYTVATGYEGDTPEWFRKLIVSNIFEFNISVMLLDTVFKMYLEKCEYTIESFDKNEIIDEVPDDEDNERIISDIRFDDIPVIDSKILKELKKKENKTIEERLAIQKFFFLKDIRDEVNNDKAYLFELYVNYGRNKFKNLRYEKGYVNKGFEIKDIVSYSVYPEIANKFSLRMEMIEKIKDKLEIKNTMTEAEIKLEKLEEILSWFEEHGKEIHSVFDIRDRNKKGKFTMRNMTDMINKVFEKWGYSKLKKSEKKQRKMVNGKRIETTPYKLEISEYKVWFSVKEKKIRQTNDLYLCENDFGNPLMNKQEM